ncbi:MAG: GNAT family N-acetyltransferase [Candidatus Cloacimonetes bacterium]|nr:GNAT family N-acetyltransferase [Candidatus Cloacimonadota bacterium]
MNNVKIIDTNTENICEYGFCGYKNIKNEEYRRKLDWLKQRFSEGMRFKVLHSEDDGDIGFIEYIPGKYTWRAIEATGYMVIHCIAVNGKYKGKGYGSLLLDSCLQDAKKENKHGVAVVTSKSTFMAGKELFQKNGFELVQEAPPCFELFVKKIKTNAPSPKFKGDWEKKLGKYGSGLTIIRSSQCPYTLKNVNEIVEVSQKNYGIKANLIELKNCIEAQNAPSAYGVFGIIYNGKLIAEHPISKKRFTNIMEKIL